MNKRQVQHAINKGFSHLEFTAVHQREVLSKVRGETVVKKKGSVGLVLAMVLLLAAVTALAVTIWNAAGEKALRLEAEKGSVYEWDTETRIAFVNDLMAMDILLPEDELAQMNDTTLPLDERDASARKIIIDLYGGPDRREDAISHRSILEKENGPFENWSLEDKAWYSQILEKYHYLGWDNWENAGYNVLPGKEDISREQAVQIAADAVSAAYGVDISDIPFKEALVSFARRSKVDPEPKWEITFSGYATVLLTPSGDITSDQYIQTPLEEAEQQRIRDEEAAAYRIRLREAEDKHGPEQYRWPLEVRAALFAPYDRMPKDSDMEAETAIIKAKEALTGTYGFDERFFDNLTAYVSLSEYSGTRNTEGSRNHETGAWNFAYSVNFDAPDQPLICGVTMLSDTGEILETYWNADGVIPSVG